jgi:hypothetical protein
MLLNDLICDRIIVGLRNRQLSVSLRTELMLESAITMAQQSEEVKH